MWCAGGAQDVAPRAIARIDQTAIAELFPRLEVERATFALPEGTFVPAQAEPCKILGDSLAKFRPAAIAIEIFDPQN